MRAPQAILQHKIPWIKALVPKMDQISTKTCPLAKKIEDRSCRESSELTANTTSTEGLPLKLTLLVQLLDQQTSTIFLPPILWLQRAWAELKVLKLGFPLRACMCRRRNTWVEFPPPRQARHLISPCWLSTRRTVWLNRGTRRRSWTQVWTVDRQDPALLRAINSSLRQT